MNFNVVILPDFKRDAKKLLKKYPSLSGEISDLVFDLETHPTQGTPLGNNCYKIRLAIASKGKGKSGGARVITCVKVIATTVYLLTIYDKSEKAGITIKELQQIMKSVF